MEQRGRKSAAELEVAQLAGIRDDRPDPPVELTAEQSDEWRAVVDRLPGDWIKREHHGVLAAYCRHVCRSRLLSHCIDVVTAESLDTPEGLERFTELAKAAERETRAVLACARTLRITHQSQYDEKAAARGAGRSPNGVRPWMS